MTNVRSYPAAVALIAAACAHAPVREGNEAEPAPRPEANPPAQPPAGTGPLPVPTRRENVVQELHGRRIADPYRWLEGDSPEVRQWVEAQNDVAEQYLHALPMFDPVVARVERLAISGEIGKPIVTREGRGFRYFYTRRSGRQDQPILLVRKTLSGPDQIVIDPNTLGSSGTASLDWFHPSPDGKRVAYGISHGGSEWSTLLVRDVDSGKDSSERIERARAADVCWEPAAKGFYYTRYPAPGAVPEDEASYHRHVYHHRLGAPPAEDRVIFGADRPMTDWPTCTLSPNGRWLIVTVYQGWNRSEVFVADTRKKPLTFARATEGQDHLFHAIARDDTIFVLTDEAAPRFRLLAFSPEEAARPKWREIIPEHETDVLKSVAVVGGRVLATYLHDAASRLVRFEGTGRLIGQVALPELGTSRGFSGHHSATEAFFDFESFDIPERVQRLDLKTGDVSIWEEVSPPPDSAVLEATRETTRSKDGTTIPFFVVRRADARKDPAPTVLYGYGGFNINLTPRYLRSTRTLVEAGAVYVQAVLRGGGEFGSGWHRAGQLERKQNVFDDFISVAEALVAKGITLPDKLGAWGRSNGGLLVASAITQRPDLFRAAVLGVPLTDMLRYERFLLARLWVPEYGSVEDPAQFEFLYGYSPYHHVRQGTRYPAVLLTTANNDTRVHPMHARKMAAALQEASTSGHPILLRSETEAGHGAGKALHQKVLEEAELYSFLLSELGLSWRETPERGAGG